MPLRRRRPRRRNNRRRIYATKASFIPKGLALKRYGQVSTKVFYFRSAGSLNSQTGTGICTGRWTTQAGGATPGSPNRMPDVADSYTIAECYNEYKVLAIRVRVFAANIGSEMGQIMPGPDRPGYNRGNTVMYLDQEIRPTEPLQTDIVNVMTYGSTRMIPSRADKHTKVLYRKKGVPEWGCCDRTVPASDRTPDPWHAGIFLLTNNARLNPSVNPLWFYTVTYKIIFRGRNFNP